MSATPPELDPEFLSEPVSRPCKIARLLDELSDEDRVKFEVALASSLASDRKIAERFTARGLHTSDQTVASHRRDTCSCAR